MIWHIAESKAGSMAKEKLLEIGDIIKCRSQEDMNDMAEALKNCGIITTRLFKRNGRTGYWLKVWGFTGKRAALAERE